MSEDDEFLKRVAEQFGCTVEDLHLMAERSNEAMHEWSEIIAKAENGTVTCIACNGNADFRRAGSSYTVECDCGFSAAGNVPESTILHTRH